MDSSAPRRLPDWSALAAPHPSLRVSVIVPVRNEARRLPAALRALAGQRQADGTPLDKNLYEVIVLANNCTDRSAGIVRSFAATHPGLMLHVVEVRFPPTLAHVGHARASLMNQACRRVRQSAGSSGIVASTDGDTRVAPDWLAQTIYEIDAGADAVGGRIDQDDDVDLPRMLKALARRDMTYQRLRSRLEHVLDPDAADPWPRHHQHFGASLAITADAYRRVGGMPAEPFLEDEALYRRLREHDMRVRHSENVRVVTSSRRRGRVDVGLSWQLRAWQVCAEARLDPAVDHPSPWVRAWQRRQALRRLWVARTARQAAGRAGPTDSERRALSSLAKRLQTSAAGLARAWQRAENFGAFWGDIEPRLLAAHAKRRHPIPMRDAIATLRALIKRHAPRPSSRRGRAGTAATASP